MTKDDDGGDEVSKTNMCDEDNLKEAGAFEETKYVPVKTGSYNTNNACSYIPFGPIKQKKNTRKLVSISNQSNLSPVTDNTDDIENLGNNFVCSICNNLIIKATRLPCNHLFCYYCIQKSIRMKPRCPLCRALISSYLTDEDADVAINELLKSYPERKAIRALLIEDRANDPEIQHLIPGSCTDNCVKDEKKTIDFESRTGIFSNAVSEDESESSFTLDSNNLEFSDNSSGSDEVEDLDIDHLSGDRAVCITLKPRCRM